MDKLTQFKAWDLSRATLPSGYMHKERKADSGDNKTHCNIHVNGHISSSLNSLIIIRIQILVQHKQRWLINFPFLFIKIKNP